MSTKRESREARFSDHAVRTTHQLFFWRLPLAAVIGFLLYVESFEPIVLAGAALIFFGNYYSLRQENRAAQPQGP